MAAPACVNCVYSICDPELWLRRLWAGAPLLPRCANHPRWPGQLRDVPGVACRNYRPKPVLPEGDVRLIPLGDGFYAYVDAADYEWLSQWTWHACASGYAFRFEKGKYVFMHRVIMKPPKGMVVDHIDGNKGNNCRLNLRVCTRQENLRNLRKQHGRRSRFKGVSCDKQRRVWVARWQWRDERCSLGRFKEEIEAARAYDYAAVAWFGRSTGLNLPAEWPPERRARVYAEARAEREAVLAKIATRQKAEKAKAKSQKTRGRKQKRSKPAPPRGKTPRRQERKRPAPDARPATKKPPAKTRRTQRSSEAA